MLQASAHGPCPQSHGSAPSNLLSHRAIATQTQSSPALDQRLDHPLPLHAGSCLPACPPTRAPCRPGSQRRPLYIARTKCSRARTPCRVLYSLTYSIIHPLPPPPAPARACKRVLTPIGRCLPLDPSACCTLHTCPRAGAPQRGAEGSCDSHKRRQVGEARRGEERATRPARPARREFVLRRRARGEVPLSVPPPPSARPLSRD